MPSSVTVPPPKTVPGSAVADTVGAWLMETVASLVVPAVTFAGRLPKPSLTLSPPSATVSWAAVKVKDCSVSPLWKVTLAGTPE